MATLRNHPGYWLRDDAAKAFDQAEADHGIFQVNSAGRTVAAQQELINRWNRGGWQNRPPYLYMPAMPADSSNHVRNGGVALDLADWRRFAQICRQYGFVHSYPDSDPVHFDYVGGYNPPDLKPDPTVNSRQRWLISRGYDLGSAGADGIPGPKYAAAVQKYQTFLRAYGYTGSSDGIWGDGTQAAHVKYVAAVNNASSTLKEQQKFLISRGYDLGSSGADGITGPKTVAAIKAYQTFLKQKYGYTGVIDGEWGAGTQAAHLKFVATLNAKPTVPAFPLPSTKWFGPEAGGDNSVSGWHHESGKGDPGLRTFQQRMKDRGWSITVDGLYGPKGATKPEGNTAEVVVAFQKEKKLTADGLIGPTTWKAAWESPITPEKPVVSPPKPTEPTTPSVPKDEGSATPNLISPSDKDFPSWIKFEELIDPDSQKADLNKEAAEYYGVPYNPVEAHLHWWGLPGQAGTHDGNVSYIRNTKDLSVNFVVSEKRVTLMVPIDKIALTTGARNPYGWKSENDPKLTDWQYKTMAYLLYIVEKLNPSLRNEPLRLHKEFMATTCSEIDKAKVRKYAEDFFSGRLDPKTGLTPATPPVNPPKPTEPTTPEVPKPTPDTVVIPKKLYDIVKQLPSEFRELASDIDEYL